MQVHSLILKTFLFQAIQFSQTVLIQTIPLSISMKFSSIWPIDRALSGTTIRDLGAMAMKGYSTFLKAPVSQEPHHQMV